MVYTGCSQIAASLDFRPIVIWRRSAADGRCVTQLMESWFQERKWRMIAIYLTEKMDTELIATTLRWARNKTYLKIEMAVLPFSEVHSYHLRSFCSSFLFFHFFFILQFREILFVDETTGQQASFTYEENSMLVAQGNYGTQLPGLFQGGGIADTGYKYQLLICDVRFYSGFFISGYTSNCFKQCHHWCSDGGSPYFRSASTSSSYAGVAFNSNGHRPLNSRLISVGLRWLWPLWLLRCYVYCWRNLASSFLSMFASIQWTLLLSV